MLRRITALLLVLTLLTSAFSAFAEDMSVSFTSSHSGEVPTSTELIFTITGTNTAAVALVVIPPSSIPVMLYGEEVRYVPTIPGPYLFAAYGTNTTDDADPAKQLCMSPYQSINVTGEELPPQQLSAQIDVQGLTRDGWESLMGQTLYLDKNLPSVDLNVTLEASALPQDAQITITLINDEGSKAVLAQEPVNGQNSWSFPQVQAVKDWFRSDQNSPFYGRYQLQAEVRLTAQDYEEAFYQTAFYVDTYTNEMRYVNQFYQNGSYLGNSRGQALEKWLDMSPRDLTDRLNSGYLLLETEYEYKDGWVASAALATVDLTNWLLEVGGSCGLSLITNPLISSLTNKELREKFGEKGEEVYPYYAQLASVYEDYVDDLLSNITDLTLTHALVEDISAHTQFIQAVTDTVDQAQPFISALINDKTETSNGWQIHLRMSKEAISHKWTLGSLGATDSGQLLFNLTDRKGVHHSMTLDELARNLVGSKAMNLFIADHVAEQISPDELVLAITASAASRKIRSQQAANAYQKKLNNFNPKKAREVKVDLGEALPNSIKSSLDVDLGSLGIRKVQYNLSVNDIFDLQLYDQLNDYEQALLSKYKFQVDKANHQVPGRSYGDIAETAISGIVLLANTWQYGTQRSAQEDLQLTYFNTICQVEEDYVQMLEKWRDSLSDTKASKKAGVEDPELMQRAINALISDIRASRNSMLTSLAKENAALFTSGQFYALSVDALTLAVDSAFKYLPCHINVQAKLAQVAAKGLDAARTSLAAITKAAGSKFNNTVLTSMSNKLAANVTAHSGASLVSKLVKSSPYVGLVGIFASLATAKGKSFNESIATMYSLKKSLVLSLRENLEYYGYHQTHQGAVDIIEGLRMMRALKISGEDLVITHTLGNLYKALDLNQGSLLAVMWNELRANDGEPLNIQAYTDHVYILYEPVILGTVKELKEQNDDLAFESGGIVNKKDTALGQQILGVYTNPGAEEASFQGQTLEPLPTNWLGPHGVNNLRDEAVGLATGSYAWVKGHTQFHPDWPNVSRDYIEHKISHSESHWYESRALYSREGLEIFLTRDEYYDYVAAQDTINDILSTYDDSYDFYFWQQLNPNPMSEGHQSQYQQRIVMYLVTMKYIDSLKMYDPTTLYD